MSTIVICDAHTNLKLKLGRKCKALLYIARRFTEKKHFIAAIVTIASLQQAKPIFPLFPLRTRRYKYGENGNSVSSARYRRRHSHSLVVCFFALARSPSLVLKRGTGESRPALALAALMEWKSVVGQWLGNGGHCLADNQAGEFMICACEYCWANN